MGIKRTALIRLSDLCPLNGLHKDKMWQKWRQTDRPKFPLYFHLIKKVHFAKVKCIESKSSFLILHKNLMVPYQNSTICFLKPKGPVLNYTLCALRGHVFFNLQEAEFP